MKEKNSIELTDDSLTNIKLMLPLLDDRTKERLVNFIYEYFRNDMCSRGKIEQFCK